ncbi:MAG: prepilin-type N-terminal cleavage/methylation domain-containing protein [Armatimonadetes bacterium]|nr:prepilin-type N-terminal cleavage/methylation domain-containing protein [Armatimonadota bacterium]
MIARTSRRQGFTLIELLVVIAIMAILAGISLPMIPGLYDQGRVVTCEARLQQIGVALRLYAEDYDQYPEALAALLQAGYLEQPAVLRCDRAGQEYVYRKAPLAAPRDTVLAACVAEETPVGRRPHRQGSISIQLLAHGGVRHQGGPGGPK